MTRKWRRIETAPRDGTLVLIFAEVGLGAAMTCARHQEIDGASYWVLTVNNGQNLYFRHNPTHWMPLPAAPVALSHIPLEATLGG